MSPAGEQDASAGGHDRRVVPLEDGRIALGSVALRVFPHSRRIRAYLRWSDKGRTREAYLGEVDGDTRSVNLQRAWALAREKGIALPDTLAAQSPAATAWASSVDVTASMRGNRSRDTKPELRLRSSLHALGLRYRVAIRPLASIRRTADVVFTGVKVAVFVDGCYWHGCPEHYRPAKRNTEFWSDKIEKNQQRDAETDRLLEQEGWIVIRVWEHEDASIAAERVRGAVLVARRRNQDRHSRGY
ncbi:very short patch repair endonuclease [Actinospica durhamensis]|nr:very short patch repair endonuclease [Actinospica durhamensis]